MRNGRKNKAITVSSEQIGRESKRDRSAMKTFPILATGFLPHHFVAVRFFPDQLNQPIDSEADLLGTPFFNNQPPDCEQLSPNSSGFTWLPATLTITTSWLWVNWYLSMDEAKDEDQRPEEFTESICLWHDQQCTRRS
jgi:hypothetical protein